MWHTRTDVQWYGNLKFAKKVDANLDAGILGHMRVGKKWQSPYHHCYSTILFNVNLIVDSKLLITNDFFWSFLCQLRKVTAPQSTIPGMFVSNSGKKISHGFIWIDMDRCGYTLLHMDLVRNGENWKHLYLGSLWNNKPSDPLHCAEVVVLPLLYCPMTWGNLPVGSSIRCAVESCCYFL